ncbi:hypothetical protein QJS66_04615 [Kocuria rhizophila]|nr:hypothetical protein QJS66_04615 [Kocuria rhizophila]
MRTSQSSPPVLDGALLREADLLTTTAVGRTSRSRGGGCSVFELLLAAVYAGIADRAIEVAVGDHHNRRSLAEGQASRRTRTSAAASPGRGAAGRIELQLRQLCADVDALARTGRLPTGGAGSSFLHQRQCRRGGPGGRRLGAALPGRVTVRLRAGAALGRARRDVPPLGRGSVRAATATSLLGPVAN